MWGRNNSHEISQMQSFFMLNERARVSSVRLDRRRFHRDQTSSIDKPWASTTGLFWTSKCSEQAGRYEQWAIRQGVLCASTGTDKRRQSSHLEETTMRLFASLSGLNSLFKLGRFYWPKTTSEIRFSEQESRATQLLIQPSPNFNTVSENDTDFFFVVGLAQRHIMWAVKHRQTPWCQSPAALCKQTI